MSTEIQSWAVVIFAGALGLVAGSFLNVVIHRGPRHWDLIGGEHRGGLARPRSYCPACKHEIPASGLIPILSYVLQRGKCRFCQSRISPRYPLVEVLGAFAALLSLFVYGPTYQAFCAAMFGWALIALAFIDLETGFLPDAITWPLIALGLGVNYANIFATFGDAVIGAVAGFVSFWFIGTIFEKLRKKEGLGQGDKKLLAAIGAWSGWAMLPFVIFAGAVITLAAIAIQALRGRKTDMNQPVPFGPGLCAAGFVALLVLRVVNAP